MDFSTSSPVYHVGMWMGTGTNLGQELPTEASDDPVDADGRALHLVGVADELGMDTYWHAGAPIDSMFSAVRLRARTGLPGGAQLIVALAGASSHNYFTDQMNGRPWRATILELTLEWRAFEVPFSELRPLGPGEPAPTYDTPWSALHLIAAPNTDYDVWVSQLELR